MIKIITHTEFFDQWDSFSVKDDQLSGVDWNDRRNELVTILSADFLFTGKSDPPADFYVYEDWFQTRVQAVGFYAWHFLCRRMIETCRDFVQRNTGWGISIVNDDFGMDYEGPATEMLITEDYIRMAAPYHSPADLRKFLVKRTDLSELIR